MNLPPIPTDQAEAILLTVATAVLQHPTVRYSAATLEVDSNGKVAWRLWARTDKIATWSDLLSSSCTIKEAAASLSAKLENAS